jgi:hypothetical protein
MVGQIKNLGEHYTTPTEITLSDGRYICKKGNKLVVCKESYCQEDIHYFEKNPKKPIPVDTIVEVNYCWGNFYGQYINVQYDGKNYDIKPQSLKFDPKFDKPIGL